MARRREAERLREEQRQVAETAALARALTDMKSRIERARSTPDAATGPLTDDVLDYEDESARGTVLAHAQTAEAAEHAQTIEIPEHPRSADDSGDPAEDASKDPGLDEFDIAHELERLLEHRRWAKREEPFRGFDSPPGRF